MDNVKWYNAASDSRMLHLWLFLELQDYISISKIALCELHVLQSPCTYLYMLIIQACNLPALQWIDESYFKICIYVPKSDFP